MSKIIPRSDRKKTTLVTASQPVPIVSQPASTGSPTSSKPLAIKQNEEVPDNSATILKLLIAQSEGEKRKNGMDFKRSKFFVKVMFKHRIYYTNMRKLCRMLQYKNLPKLFKKGLHIVIVECDEKYVSHHGFKNYVNVGGNLLEVFTSEFIGAKKDRHLYHKIVSLTKSKQKFNVTTTQTYTTGHECYVYTIERNNVEIGTVICPQDNVLMSKESRIRLQNSDQLVYPIRFTLFSEQSTKGDVQKRLNVLETEEMEKQIISTIATALTYGSDSATSNLDSEGNPKGTSTDIGFDTNSNIYIQSVKDLIDALVWLFKQSRLAFVEASEFPCADKALKFEIGNQSYFIACYDHLTGSYSIYEREGDEYISKLKRFVEGKHIGKNADGFGTDEINPDFVFVNYFFDESTEQFYNFDDKGQKNYLKEQSGPDVNYYLTKIAKMFPKLKDKKVQQIIKEIENHERISRKTLTKAKENVTSFPEYTPQVIELSKVDLKVTEKEIIWNGIPLPYHIGDNRVLIDVNELGISDYVTRQKDRLNGISIETNYFGKGNLKDYLKKRKKYSRQIINRIYELISEIYPKEKLDKLVDKDRIEDFSCHNFDKLIINGLYDDLNGLTNFDNWRFIIPNPNYLIDLIAKENGIDLDAIVKYIKDLRLDLAAQELAKLTDAINKEFKKPLKCIKKIEFKDETKKYKFIEEAVKKFLEEKHETFDEERFMNILFDVFASHVELPDMNCKSEIIRSSLDEFCGLDCDSDEEAWIKMFISPELMNSTTQTDKEKLEIELKKVHANYSIFANYFEAEDRCRWEDNCYNRAATKTLDKVF